MHCPRCGLGENQASCRQNCRGLEIGSINFHKEKIDCLVLLGSRLFFISQMQLFESHIVENSNTFRQRIMAKKGKATRVCGLSSSFISGYIISRINAFYFIVIYTVVPSVKWEPFVVIVLTWQLSAPKGLKESGLGANLSHAISLANIAVVTTRDNDEVWSLECW